MKRTLSIIAYALITVAVFGQDQKNYGRYTTLRLAVLDTEFNIHSNKIVKALCRYEFKTSNLTQAMTNTVLGRFNWTSFCAIVNPAKDVYVYDCPTMKAGNFMSFDDLATIKGWVDNNPKIAVDWIRDDERAAFDLANGVRNEPGEE